MDYINPMTAVKLSWHFPFPDKYEPGDRTERDTEFMEWQIVVTLVSRRNEGNNLTPTIVDRNQAFIRMF